MMNLSSGRRCRGGHLKPDAILESDVVTLPAEA